MTTDHLYYEDSIDLLEAADPQQVLDEHSDEAVIGRAVETARAILAASGYDMALPPNLLLGKTKARCWEHHFAARVLYHARGMHRAVQDGRILDVRKHALHFATWLERAKHTDAWGPAVLQQRRRAEASRSNLADRNAALRAEAERRWAPWRDTYFALLRRGLSKGEARKEVGDKMSEESGELPDDKTLSKWLP
jgi:hypothetical protein